MIEFKSTKGYTYCAGGVRCCGYVGLGVCVGLNDDGEEG